MYKLMCLILIAGMLAVSGTAFAEDDLYLIDKDVRLLAFVGPIGARVVKPVLYLTAVKQYITLLHQDSGPGIYAFYLKGTIVRDKNGEPITIPDDGFFIVRKKLVKEYKGGN
jgi:hypothetical protein